MTREVQEQRREDVKVGDVVQLNSGGPVMTVTEVKSEYVSVYWFPDVPDPTLQSETLCHGTYQVVPTF